MPSRRRLLSKRSFLSDDIATNKKCPSGLLAKRRSSREDVLNNDESNSNGMLTRSSARKRLNSFKASEKLSVKSVHRPINIPKFNLGFILSEKLFGYPILNNLLKSGHKLTVCLLGFSEEVERKFSIMGAEIVASPLDVWRKADVIISYSPSAQQAKSLIFGDYDVLQELKPSKCFVEMTCIDADTSSEIDFLLKSHGVKYLEAQIQGSIKEAVSGYLVILTAGDESLYKICQSCFEAIGCHSYFHGKVGSACKINLAIKMMISISIAGLAEGLALAKHIGFRVDDVLEVICMTGLSSALFLDKGICMIKEEYPTEMTLNQMQRHLSSVQNMAEEAHYPLPITTTVNEKFKECILLGLGDKDVSAVYEIF